MEEKECVLYIPSLINDDDMYETIDCRQPTILRKAADNFLRNYRDYLKVNYSDQLTEEQLKEADEDAKKVFDEIIDYIKKPVFNEHLTKFEDSFEDVPLWDLKYDEYVLEHSNRLPNYYDTSLLWTECFMYRSLISAFLKSKYYKEYDAFEKIKQEGFHSARIAATRLIEYTSGIAQRIRNKETTCEEQFGQFLEFALWGNRFDLSCNYGFTNSDNFQLADDLKKQKHKIVSNSTQAIYEHFKSSPNKVQKITIVLDNAGFELLGDICFIEMLYQTGLIDENSEIIFHYKIFPWFVSDVTRHDFTWLLDCLADEFESQTVKRMAKRWSNFLATKKWHLTTHLYWTTCWPCADMKRLAPDLYDELSKSDLALFCGDLNHRKLINDFVWDIRTPFEVALKGFCPTNIVSIRTIKCRPVVAVDKNAKLPDDYWFKGDHGVIHFYKKK